MLRVRLPHSAVCRSWPAPVVRAWLPGALGASCLRAALSPRRRSQSSPKEKAFGRACACSKGRGTLAGVSGDPARKPFRRLFPTAVCKSAQGGLSTPERACQLPRFGLRRRPVDKIYRPFRFAMWTTFPLTLDKRGAYTCLATTIRRNANDQAPTRNAAAVED